MKIKAITNAKAILLSFIIVSLLITSICYASPNIQSFVCDVTIISRTQTKYKFLPIECMYYSYWEKNCNEIKNLSIETFNNTAYGYYLFYNESVLEVNKTYRIRANSFAYFYDVHLITDSNTDLYTVAKSVCQSDSMNASISYIIDFLIILAVLFFIWRVYKKSKTVGIIIFVLLLFVFLFILVYYSG